MGIADKRARVETGTWRHTNSVLDMTNPQVQDFAFKIVDDLLTQYPEISYIKWDANASIQNYGSLYLPRHKQANLYIDYHRGLISVLERIRKKYPDIVIQDCASGADVPTTDCFPTSTSSGFLTIPMRCSVSTSSGVLHYFSLPMPWHSTSVVRLIGTRADA